MTGGWVRRAPGRLRPGRADACRLEVWLCLDGTTTPWSAKGWPMWHPPDVSSNSWSAVFPWTASCCAGRPHCGNTESERSRALRATTERAILPPLFRSNRACSRVMYCMTRVASKPRTRDNAKKPICAWAQCLIRSLGIRAVRVRRSTLLSSAWESRRVSADPLNGVRDTFRWNVEKHREDRTTPPSRELRNFLQSAIESRRRRPLS